MNEDSPGAIDAGIPPLEFYNKDVMHKINTTARTRSTINEFHLNERWKGSFVFVSNFESCYCVGASLLSICKDIVVARILVVVCFLDQIIMMKVFRANFSDQWQVHDLHR